jgi:hypothetical protein
LKIRGRENPDRFPKLRIAFLESGGVTMAGWLDASSLRRGRDERYEVDDAAERYFPPSMLYLVRELVGGSLKYLAE